ncbi:hypothetical protein F5883DRAFT_211073 [Diaporthe sp. PMI_573]|nr:hypothetical protein F5883DRAFT_211073 [Diaporthaceae sp. PMI_573]
MEDEGGDPPLVTLVVKEYRKLTRGSKGVKEALRKAEQADENSLEGIILKLGDTSWRAFYAAKKAATLKHGFDGQARLAQLLNHLSAAPLETQRAFAEQLATAMGIDDEPSVESNTLPMESNGVCDGRNRAKRRRTESYTTPTTMNDTATHHTSLDHYAPEQASGKAARLEIGAPLSSAQELFHDQFWDCIERIPSTEHANIWLANITIFSQNGGQREYFGYQVQIAIMPEKVPDIAAEYFGVKIEIKDGVRYVRYPGAGIVEGDSAVILRESITRDYSRLFKGELLEAHRASPVYQSEEEKKLSHTQSVSLTISNQAKETGKMTVFLGDWRAVRIHQKLYG